MNSWHISLIIGCFSLASCSFVPQTQKAVTPKKSIYEEVNLEEMIRRYISKTQDQYPTIEGIYSVTSVISKKSKSLLSGVEKDRIVLRRENYARVAIIKDWPGSNKEFIELSLSDKNSSQYPIVAELHELSEGGGFIYKHFEPKGKVLTYTFLYDLLNPDILEGIYKEVKNSAEITYKLSYVKIYPKNSNY